MYSQIQCRFAKIQSIGQEVESESFKPEGLYRIEAENPIYGEKVHWSSNSYRLKHVISGRYLCLDPENQDQPMSLDKEPCPETLFTFERVETKDPAQENSRTVAIDSKYKLKSKHSRGDDCFLTLPMSLLAQDMHSPRKDQASQADQQVDEGAEVLYATIAAQQFVREKQFLSASFPVFIELLISLEELNKEIIKLFASSEEAQEEASPINYTRFDQVAPKVHSLLKSLTDYLENRALSYIE